MSLTQTAHFVSHYLSCSEHYKPPMIGEEMAPSFEDGKLRAIRVLERRIEEIRGLTLDTYMREVCPQQVDA